MVDLKQTFSQMEHDTESSFSTESPSTYSCRDDQTNVSVERRASNWSKLRATVRVASAVRQRQKKKSYLNRQDSFLRKFSALQSNGPRSTSIAPSFSSDVDTQFIFKKRKLVIRPEGSFMFYWMAILTVSILYNLWTCIAREAFYEIQVGHFNIWIPLDIFSDLIYILDIAVQFRTGYLEQGLMVCKTEKLTKKYLHCKNFILDICSLLPLDFLQFIIGVHPMIRFPRFIKSYRLFRFIHMVESRTAYPNLFRVTNLTHILFLGAHWFAAFYYLISEAEDFRGSWSYPKPDGEFALVSRKYLASLYWSTLTLTTIGDLPPPVTMWEYVFVIGSYLIGVFIFATIVGQVGNVITNRNASRQEFERLLDGAKFYMQSRNVPKDLQKRVQRWYDYVWSRGRMNGTLDISSLGMLPDKLKTELALNINLETLKKVTIFQECQPEFLHDLVLKMRAHIFTPGDLICRRGEVAREMFIIVDGVVEIISEDGLVLTRMSTGDFFGEIGILNLHGGINRRTADVRSVGYSELFVLSKEDVLAALMDHPEAESIIREYGQKRLKQIEAHRKNILISSKSACKELVQKGLQLALTKDNYKETTQLPQSNADKLLSRICRSPRTKQLLVQQNRSCKRKSKSSPLCRLLHKRLPLMFAKSSSRYNQSDGIQDELSAMCTSSECAKEPVGTNIELHSSNSEQRNLQKQKHRQHGRRLSSIVHQRKFSQGVRYCAVRPDDSDSDSTLTEYEKMDSETTDVSMCDNTMEPVSVPEGGSQQVHSQHKTAHDVKKASSHGSAKDPSIPLSPKVAFHSGPRKMLRSLSTLKSGGETNHRRPPRVPSERFSPVLKAGIAENQWWSSTLKPHKSIAFSEDLLTTPLRQCSAATATSLESISLSPLEFTSKPTISSIANAQAQIGTVIHDIRSEMTKKLIELDTVYQETLDSVNKLTIQQAELIKGLQAQILNLKREQAKDG